MALGELFLNCHPGKLAELIRDPAFPLYDLGPGATLRYSRDDRDFDSLSKAPPHQIGDVKRERRRER